MMVLLLSKSGIVSTRSWHQPVHPHDTLLSLCSRNDTRRDLMEDGNGNTVYYQQIE